jgi:hypothetical protein
MNFNFLDTIKKQNFTFKHASTYLDNELKQSGMFGQKNARRFKDITTDNFTNIFLADDVIRANFIDYTFHQIKYNILYKYRNNLDFNELDIDNSYCVNQNIANLRCLNDENQKISIDPLLNDEKIFIIFKGGNVMSMFYRDIIDKLLQKFNNITIQDIHNVHSNVSDIKNIYGNSPTIKDFFKDNISKNFKISDVDYSIYIDTPNYDRYIFLHGLVVKILAKTLHDIKDFFNNYYNHVLNNQSNNYITMLKNFKTFNSNDDPDINTITTLKKYLVLLKNNHHNNAIVSIIVNDMIIIINNINNINSINNIEYCQILLDYIFYIIFFNNKYTFNININNLLNINDTLLKRCELLLLNKKAKIVQNNLYTINKINNFLQNISISYNDQDLVSNERYELSTENFKQHEVAYKVDPTKLNGQNIILPNVNNNLEIKGRSDSIIKANNHFLNQKQTFTSSSNTTNIHYCTFNNIIRKQRNNGSYISDFDLMRVKFNVVLKNYIMKNNILLQEYKIPAEFIDVSIPTYFDTTKKLFLDEVNHYGIYTYTLSINNHNYYIDCYNLDQLIHDLINVLYGQNTFIPWVDPKYEKRIERLIILNTINLIDINNIISIKNNEFDIFKKLLDIINDIYNHINIITNNNNFPYNSFIDYLSYDSPILNSFTPITPDNKLFYTKFKIENIFDSNNLFIIIDPIKSNIKYNYYKKIIDSILIWGRLYYVDNNIILDFLNKARTAYIWDKYLITDTIDNTPIIDFNKNKFKKIVQSFINIGFISKYILDNINNPYFGGYYITKNTYKLVKY